ncbi:alpha/beta hydrolase [Williamsoniiplasma somnilux]
MNIENSMFAKAMISMWNSHFARTVYKREDGKDIKINIIDMFNWNPTNFDSNKKMGIKEVKNPTASIFLSSKDNLKIAASIWLNPKPTKKWIVGIHGYNSTRFDVLYLTWHYRELGYNIITFDFRNHGASGIDIVSWGYKEKWDLMAVINWLIKSYSVQEIGLVGTSMGAFTMNYFILSEPELIKKANIKWGISDSSYMSVPELLKKMVFSNAPKILGGYAKETLKTMLKIYKQEYNVDLTRLDFISLIKPDDKHPPILYLHNRYDRITNSMDSFRMCNIKNSMENSEENEVKIFDGKHHTKAIIEDQEIYKEITLKFVKKHQK